MQKFIIRVDAVSPQILKGLTEDCYVLNTALDGEYCRQFVETAAAENKIVLFYGDDAMQKVHEYGADGVILDLGEEALKIKMAAVRKELGKGKAVGLITRNRRHESMVVSEAEPDFVVFRVWKDGFDKVKDLTDWYNDFFLIQSAAWIMEEGIDIAALKTDFVIK